MLLSFVQLTGAVSLLPGQRRLQRGRVRGDRTASSVDSGTQMWGSAMSSTREVP